MWIVVFMPTEAEKKRFLSEHFIYEVHMIGVSAEVIIQENQKPIFDQDKINMSLECLLLHGRNLIEFFYYSGNQRDYARAHHYIEKSQWLQLRPSKGKYISELEKRASQEIVHLSYKRYSGITGEKRWDVSNVLRDILKTTRIFVNNLPKIYVSEEIKKLIEEIKALHYLDRGS